MLDAIRKGARTWTINLFIALLVLSFAVWGIADIFGGYGTRTVATIGDQKVSTEAYRAAYQTELQRLSVQLNRRVTSEQARLFGLEQQVLSQIVGTTAMDVHASDLGLGISDGALVNRFKRNPVFQDAAGKFSAGNFNQVLRANGLSEQGFLRRERGNAVRAQISTAMVDGLASPTTLLDAMNKFRNTSRSLDYFVLPESTAGVIAAPEDEQLKTYFEANKRQFMAPEYRKIELLSATPGDLSETISITDEDLKATFEERADRFNTPEKRRVQQISFPDLAAADKAYADIQSGTDFLEIAKAAGRTESDIDLGVNTQAALLDQSIAKAAFALDKDAVSKPVQGDLSVALIRVTEITPGITKTYDDVKEQVRSQMLQERGKEEIETLLDEVEDARAGGSTLKEIADKFNIKYLEIAAIDREGKDPSGTAVSEIPDTLAILRAAYASDVGIENEPLEVSGNGFAWYDVIDVIPEKLKDFDTIKSDVESAWRKSEVGNALSKKAREYVDQINTGKPLADIASQLNIETSKIEKVTRNTRASNYPQALLSVAFNLAKGRASSVANDGAGGRTIFQIREITAPDPLAGNALTNLKTQIDQQISNDLVAQYISGLQTEYGVSVNQQAFRYVTGQQPLQ